MAVVRIGEVLIRFLLSGGGINDFPDYLVEHFSWTRFLSIQIWLMVLFINHIAFSSRGFEAIKQHLAGKGVRYRVNTPSRSQF